jgi:hypothetical protein
MLDLSGRTGKYPIFRTSRQETARQRDPSIYIQRAALSLTNHTRGGNVASVRWELSFSLGLAAAPIALVQMDRRQVTRLQRQQSTAHFKHLTALTTPGLCFLDCFALSFITPASLFCYLLLSVAFAYPQSSLNLPSNISKWSSDRSIRMPLKACVLKIN